jgi:hypothetical protein
MVCALNEISNHAKPISVRSSQGQRAQWTSTMQARLHAVKATNSGYPSIGQQKYARIQIEFSQLTHHAQGITIDVWVKASNVSNISCTLNTHTVSSAGYHVMVQHLLWFLAENNSYKKVVWFTNSRENILKLSINKKSLFCVFITKHEATVNKN